MFFGLGSAIVILSLLVFSLGVAGNAPKAEANAGFKKWIKGFYSVARKNGITRGTYNLAFKGITSPDPEIIELTRYQPEFRQQMWMYFDSRVNEDSISRGKAEKANWSPVLARIELQKWQMSALRLKCHEELNVNEIIENDCAD